MDGPLENLDCEYFDMPIYDPACSIWIGPGKWKEKTEKRNSQIYFLIMKFNPLSIQCHFILNFIMFGVSQIITFFGMENKFDKIWIYVCLATGYQREM